MITFDPSDSSARVFNEDLSGRLRSGGSAISGVAEGTGNSSEGATTWRIDYEASGKRLAMWGSPAEGVRPEMAFPSSTRVPARGTRPAPHFSISQRRTA